MKISVITASYNYEQYIGETIESVLNQTYTDWEMIIVDDGSTDGSVEVIKSYNDPRIKLIENGQNKGLKETLLTGIAQASGEWAAFLESDDLWTPDYLEKKVAIAKKYPKAALIFNDCELFGDEERFEDVNGHRVPNRKWLRKQKFPKNIFYGFYVHNRISTFSSVMCKKEPLQKLNFNTPIECLLDWWLWIQLAEKNEFYYIDEKLTKWRLHRQSYIQNTPPLRTPLALQWKAYAMLGKKYLPFLVFSQIVWIFPTIKRKTRNFLVKQVWKKFFHHE
ncbi:MAG: glycosyltransferase [Heliobacteriaceae bacterium]|jgi:glycosyltransferase involved in cell wall biosynthesis|nr:glycosyltransferase [Heliobacteriaceae bacterium]